MEQPNLNYINEISGDDIEFKNKMISILKKEMPLEAALYHEKIKGGQYMEAALMVHKIKHKISILGLEKSYYIAEKFEINLKNNSTDLIQDFEAVLQSMQNFVDNL